jgi:hypothetical protein
MVVIRVTSILSPLFCRSPETSTVSEHQERRIHKTPAYSSFTNQGSLAGATA